jgi:hypothetical protein
MKDDIKSVKNVLKMIAGMLQAKMNANEQKTAPGNEKEAYMNLDTFFHHYVHQSYGIEDLANKYCEIYLLSIDAHRGRDLRIELVRKFIGIDSDRMPNSVFDKFLSLVKATNIPVLHLFTKNINQLSIDYNKVRYSLKDLLHGCDAKLMPETLNECRKFCRTSVDNPRLEKKMTTEVYEVYRDLQEQIIRSRFHSMTHWIRELLEAEGSGSGGTDSEYDDSEDREAKANKTVTLEELATALVTDFDLSDYVRGGVHLTITRTKRRVTQMLQALVVDAQGAAPSGITA